MANDAADAPAFGTEQLDQLNRFLNDATPDASLTCPVTGERVPITEWNAPDSILMLPSLSGGDGYQAVALTSPAGGVVLLSMVKITAATAPPDEAGKRDEGV